MKDISVQEDVPVRIAFAVPKKSFKKAVDRNLIRRRLKEAYRKSKEPLFEVLGHNGKKIIVMVIYLGKVIDSYSAIEESMKVILKLITERVSDT